MRHAQSSSRRIRLARSAVCSLLGIASAAVASATPIAIPIGAKRVFDFDVVGYPAGRNYSGDGVGERRIFVNRNAKHAEVRIQSTEGDWGILDCNATFDSKAALTARQAAIYDVYVRLLDTGRRNLSGCTDTQTDLLNGETLCHLGTVDLTRGAGASRLDLTPSWLFDPSLKDVTWAADPVGKARVVQIRVYSPPEPIAP